MDIPRLRYSDHARRRMRQYALSEDEIEAIVWCPASRIVTHRGVEHYGYADDGREFKVVTNQTETKVITITREYPRRPRYGRKTTMQQPIQVTVDEVYPVGYVEYKSFEQECDYTLRLLREPDGRVQVYGSTDGRRDDGCGVHVDFNANDEIVGLEILSVDEADLLAIAKDFAAQNDLAFPADIRAVAVPAA